MTATYGHKEESQATKIAFLRTHTDPSCRESIPPRDMLRALLTQHHVFVPFRLVRPPRGKQIRPHPASPLYERGHVHHAGRFPDLEDQLCHYDGTGSSPDRMDALVWALTDLFPQTRRSDPKVRTL